MIDENKLMTNIQELIVSQTSIDGRNYQDELINSYNEALHDVLKTIEEQPKDHDLAWYKHEYYAECDRADKLEKALDNAIKQCCIGVTGSDACNSLDELYEAFEKKVWENVE